MGVRSRRKGCRVADFPDGVVEDEASWPTYIDWFLDRQVRLRSAVSAMGGVTAIASAAEAGSWNLGGTPDSI